MSVDTYEELYSLAGVAARRVSYQWPDVVTKEDLQQDIVAHLLLRPGALDRFFAEPDRETRQKFLIKVAHQQASKEMLDYDRFTANFYYDTAAVKEILDVHFGYPGTGDHLPEVHDLKEALDALADKKSSHFAEIINRYQFNIVGETSTEKMRTSRAVEALTQEMNLIGARRRRDFIEGPGTRRVASNAVCQSVVTSDERN